MNRTTPLDPRISEFETQEQANRYTSWFRARVQEAIDSETPLIPHDQVMAEMWAVIEQHSPKKATA
ncbi:type II toxin-antitoxin system RelB family antitoxin [Allofranklinella schreckenbergeri]|uniref:type II toxin-antitoxin system RelB family antitoxin n=1 Tax=Allofranklinella schreckenbergeri TaxID=1076744 RepID=UPI001EEE2459|nr:stability determinant [Allofranklinella schreckenbergeri]